MNEVLYQIDRPGQGSVLLKCWFSDSEPESDGCGACIGYQIFDPENHICLDGGELEYNPDTAGYTSIDDAVADIAGFAFDLAKVDCKKRTDLDPDDFVD